MGDVMYIVLEGEVADPANPPSGCYFHPRCRYQIERCVTEELELREMGIFNCELSAREPDVGSPGYKDAFGR